MTVRELQQKLARLLSQIYGSNLRGESERTRDERVHERFDLCIPGGMVIRTEDQEIHKVINISYGGFASESQSGTQEDKPRGQKAEVIFMGDKCSALIHRVYQSTHHTGYRFEHRDSTTLVFLRDILEHLRLGSTLHILRKEFLKNEYHSDDWVCMRGEGPTDLFIRTNEDSVAGFIVLTFRVGEQYNIFRLENNQYSVSRQDSSDSQINFPKDPDPAILRQVLCIFLGIKDPAVIRILAHVYHQGKAYLESVR